MTILGHHIGLPKTTIYYNISKLIYDYQLQLKPTTTTTTQHNMIQPKVKVIGFDLKVINLV